MTRPWYLEGNRPQAEEVFAEVYAQVEEADKAETASWIAMAYRNTPDDEKHREWATQKHRKWAAQAGGVYAHREEGFRSFLGRRKRNNRSATAFRAALRIDPEDGFSNWGLAWAYPSVTGRAGPARVEELREMLRCAEKAAAVYPLKRNATDADFGVQVRLVLVILYLYENRLDDAKRVAQRCIDLSKDSLAPIAYAWVLAAEGNWDAAEDAMRRVVSENGWWYQWGALGSFLLKRQKYKEAAQAFERSFKFERGVIDRTQLAHALNELGQYDEAIRQCHLALEGLWNTGENTAAYENLAYALWKSGDSEEALNVADEGIREIPDRPNLYLVRGLILKNNNRFDEAMQSFREALKLRPVVSLLWDPPEFQEVTQALNEFRESEERKTADRER